MHIRELLLNVSYREAALAELWFLNVLENLFREVKAEVMQVTKGCPTSNAGELASLWREHLSTGKNRKYLYERVQNSKGLYSKSFIGTHPCIYNEKTVPAQRDESDMALTNAIMSTRHSLVHLISLLETLRGPLKHKVQVIMYFDEAHVLCSVEKSDNKHTTATLYDILCSTLNHLYGLSIFVVFLSTSLHTPKLAPPSSVPSSLRARQSGIFLHDPITEVSFDCHPDILVKLNDPALTLEKLGSLEFLVRFGRPL